MTRTGRRGPKRRTKCSQLYATVGTVGSVGTAGNCEQHATAGIRLLRPPSMCLLLLYIYMDYIDPIRSYGHLNCRRSAGRPTLDANLGDTSSCQRALAATAAATAAAASAFD